MAAIESLTGAVDQIIAFFNARQMDLPDGLFDRKTQFVINGAPFETLLGQPPDDPLVLMLARGPAGFRFTTKTLQHAMPDARLERPSTQLGPSATDPVSLRAGGPNEVVFELWLYGRLRETGEAVSSVVTVKLRLAAAGYVEVAEATVDPGVLGQLRQARLRP
jgi:hypothetical protein